MSSKELLESWHEHGAPPRTARSWAVRPPLEDAARLAALAQMFMEPARLPCTALAGSPGNKTQRKNAR